MNVLYVISTSKNIPSLAICKSENEIAILKNLSTVIKYCRSIYIISIAKHTGLSTHLRVVTVTHTTILYVGHRNCCLPYETLLTQWSFHAGLLQVRDITLME